MLSFGLDECRRHENGDLVYILCCDTCLGITTPDFNVVLFGVWCWASASPNTTLSSGNTPGFGGHDYLESRRLAYVQ